MQEAPVSPRVSAYTIFNGCYWTSRLAALGTILTFWLSSECASEADCDRPEPRFITYGTPIMKLGT